MTEQDYYLLQRYLAHRNHFSTSIDAIKNGEIPGFIKVALRRNKYFLIEKEYKITGKNWGKNSNAFFDEVQKPDHTGTKIFESESGSEYGRKGNYLIRYSGHGGSQIASCNWFLRGYPMGSSGHWFKGGKYGKVKLCNMKHYHFIPKKIINEYAKKHNYKNYLLDIDRNRQYKTLNYLYEFE